jgi:phenylalanyl-tRNA synthetase alpha chain
MVAAVAGTIAPDARRQPCRPTIRTRSPGAQLDVMRDGTWIEIGECGLADPGVLAAAGLAEHHGLAMGIGLDRAVMLRKSVDDIRLLRDPDPRIASQVSDLAPYRPISTQPAARRDLSVMCRAGLDAEQIGDRVREALGACATWVEEVTIVERTPYSALRPAARARMGAVPGQENLLIGVRLRNPSRSLPKREANAIRDQVYAACTRAPWTNGR